MNPESLRSPPYGLPQRDKAERLLAELVCLTQHHIEHCESYARLVRARGLSALARIGELSEVPHIPVGLFKTHRLASVPEGAVFKVLTSSGTTSQQVSRIYLDRETAALQSEALASIMTSLLGPKRLPMLIVDSPAVLKHRTQFSARGAGVLGMMSFGRSHRYVLDDGMNLDRAALETFLSEHGDKPFLLFGFTYMVWEYFLSRLVGAGLDLSKGVLVHSGGWKKLQDRAIDNANFRAAFKAETGLARIHNFYGMVEQVGSVFLEGDDGFLYPPWFADVIVRDPRTWKEAALGEVGVLEVLSALPRSYPGHALLTEDLGVVHGIDDSTCGRGGKRFSVIGRVPLAELRGCSDTHAQEIGR